MRNFLAIFFRGNRGFSLVQALVTGSVMAGLGLVVMKLSNQSSSNKTAVETSYGIYDLTGRIQTLVSNNVSCTNSFAGISLATNSTTTLANLKSSANAPVFVVGSEYSNKTVRISGMNLRRQADKSILTVTMEKNVVGKNTLGGRTINREFFITADWVGDFLTSCSSDITNFMDTVVSQSINDACGSGSLGLVRDPTTCRVLGQLGTANFTCPVGQSIVSLSFNPATRIYTPVCRHIVGDIPLCPSNQLLRRNSSGVWSCVSINCPPNSIAQGLDASGNMRCFACPSGTYMVSTPGGWQCRTTTCNNSKTISQQYFVGFRTTGDPICNPIIDSALACPKGGVLKTDSSGSVSMDCCSPDCSGSGSFCSGTSYSSSNGCGTCQGTRAPDCSNAGNYCTGTKNAAANGCGYCTGTKPPDCSGSGSYCSGRSYPAANGCGICVGSKPTDCSDNANYCSGETYNANDGCGQCTGTKPTKNADWGPWVATNEYQNKPGATCSASCGPGTVQMQRKYTRACLNNQDCNGSTCIGPRFTWVDEGTQSCNLADCCTPTTVWSHYTCEKTIPGKQWINNCFYKQVCAQNHSMLLSGPWWDGLAGPTSAAGGDTSTQSNCRIQRLKCSGEP